MNNTERHYPCIPIEIQYFRRRRKRLHSNLSIFIIKSNLAIINLMIRVSKPSAQWISENFQSGEQTSWMKEKGHKSKHKYEFNNIDHPIIVDAKYWINNIIFGIPPKYHSFYPRANFGNWHTVSWSRWYSRALSLKSNHPAPMCMLLQR